MSTEEILAAALALPEADRRVLLERLADSLPEGAGDPGDLYSDPAFQAELDRREVDFDSHSIDGEVVLANLRARFEKARAAG